MAKAFNALAAMACLFGVVFIVPVVSPHVDGPLWLVLSDLYSAPTTRWLHWAGMIALYPTIFFALRIAVSAAFVAAALMINRYKQ